MSNQSENSQLRDEDPFIFGGNQDAEEDRQQQRRFEQNRQFNFLGVNPSASVNEFADNEQRVGGSSNRFGNGNDRNRIEINVDDAAGLSDRTMLAAVLKKLDGLTKLVENVDQRVQILETNINGNASVSAAAQPTQTQNCPPVSTQSNQTNTQQVVRQHVRFTGSPQPTVGGNDLLINQFIRTQTQLIRANECQMFAQISNSLKNLSGSESRSHIRIYFEHFEAITAGWTDHRRAQLIVTHLTGQARLILDGLSSCQRNSYMDIKESILRENCQIDSLRYQAQINLQRGMKPGFDENLREYGMRVLATIRDSLLMEIPEKVVEDMAKAYFMSNIHNPRIHDALVLLHDQSGFHHLIDKAEEIHQRISVHHQFNTVKPAQNRQIQNADPNWLGNGNIQANPPQNFQTESNLNSNVVLWPACANTSPMEFQNRAQNRNVHFSSVNTIADQNSDGNSGLFPSSPNPFVGYLEGKKLNEQAINMSLFGIGVDSKHSIGPTLKIQISSHGCQLEALVDCGANVNVISRKAVKEILKAGGKTLDDLKVRPSHFGSSMMVNTESMTFIANISLQIKCGNMEKLMEFEVAEGELPFPVILGTAGLSSLGFQLITPDGLDMLASQRNEVQMGNFAQNAQVVVQKAKKMKRKNRKNRRKAQAEQSAVAPECANFQAERGTSGQRNCVTEPPSLLNLQQYKPVFRPRVFYNRTMRSAYSPPGFVNTKPSVPPLLQFESHISSTVTNTKLPDNEMIQHSPSPSSPAHLQAERSSAVNRVPSDELEPLIEPRGSVFRGGGVVMCG